VATLVASSVDRALGIEFYNDIGLVRAVSLNWFGSCARIFVKHNSL